MIVVQKILAQERHLITDIEIQLPLFEQSYHTTAQLDSVTICRKAVVVVSNDFPTPTQRTHTMEKPLVMQNEIMRDNSTVNV
jgi:hypothetical protein